MKAVITGHSGEIGQIVKNIFPDYEWIDVGRSSDIDLRTDQGVNDLLKFSKYADIFFNIANVGPNQGYILKKVFEIFLKQKNKDPKKIINFGSLITTLDSNFQENKQDYISSKLYLEKVHKECCDQHINGWQLDYAVPQSILIRFGHILEKEERGKQPYTNKDQLIEVVRYAVESKSYISDIDVRWQ